MFPVQQIMENTVEVVQTVSERVVEQVVDVPVPQIMTTLVEPIVAMPAPQIMRKTWRRFSLC